MTNSALASGESVVRRLPRQIGGYARGLSAKAATLCVRRHSRFGTVVTDGVTAPAC